MGLIGGLITRSTWGTSALHAGDRCAPHGGLTRSTWGNKNKESMNSHGIPWMGTAIACALVGLGDAVHRAAEEIVHLRAAAGCKPWRVAWMMTVACATAERKPMTGDHGYGTER